LNVIERELVLRRIWQPIRFDLPDFLGIGVPQSGTTWLYENLRAHPGVALPTNKELGYFSRRRRFGPGIIGLAHYSRILRSCGPGVRGEISPDYATVSERAVRYIHALVPRVRLVIILREPVERVWSSLRRLLFLTRPPHALDDLETECNRLLSNRPQILEASMYADVLSRWWSVFDASQLLILFHDNVRDNPEGSLLRVFDHLDIEHPTDWSGFPLGERVNPNPELEIPASLSARLESIFRPETMRLASMIDGVPGHWRR
jgi:hypothetical protein